MARGAERGASRMIVSLVEDFLRGKGFEQALTAFQNEYTVLKSSQFDQHRTRLEVLLHSNDDFWSMIENDDLDSDNQSGFSSAVSDHMQDSDDDTSTGTETSATDEQDGVRARADSQELPADQTSKSNANGSANRAARRRSDEREQGENGDGEDVRAVDITQDIDLGLSPEAFRGKKLAQASSRLSTHGSESSEIDCPYFHVKRMCVPDTDSKYFNFTALGVNEDISESARLGGTETDSLTSDDTDTASASESDEEESSPARAAPEDADNPNNVSNASQGRDSVSGRRRSKSHVARAAYEPLENFPIVARVPLHDSSLSETPDILLAPGVTVGGRYTVLDLAGVSRFSRCCRCIDRRTGALVCLKVSRNAKDVMDQAVDEARIMHLLRRAAPTAPLVQYIEHFYYREHFCIAMEPLGASLLHVLHRDQDFFSLERVVRIARQVLEALQALHELELAHCDIKPENILFAEEESCAVKIADFGTVCHVHEGTIDMSYVQSRSYRAPEVMLGADFDEKVDIWSVGCVIVEMLVGSEMIPNDPVPVCLARLQALLGPLDESLLHRSPNRDQMITSHGCVFEQVSNGVETEFFYLKVDDNPLRNVILESSQAVAEADDAEQYQIVDFVHSLLAIDPEIRPSAAEALQHPLFSASRS